ncbi:MAG: CPBP family intramembrane glutamic endopeptidase [Anaerolineae bacterium]
MTARGRKHESWITKHALPIYFVLAAAFSWAVEIPLALNARGVTWCPAPLSVHYLAGYGPMLAAIVTTALTEGRAGLRELLRRMWKWRVRPIWWAFALSPLLLFSLIVLIEPAQGGLSALRRLGEVDAVPTLGLLALPFWFVTFGIGEETGWRGFALPRLQSRHTALGATVILWVGWATWHLPMFFYLYEPVVAPGMVLGLLAGAIALTWLFNSTGGSALLAALWHSTFNLTTACTSCKIGVEPAILSAAVMAWAVVVVILFKPASLSKARKHVYPQRDERIGVPS